MEFNIRIGDATKPAKDFLGQNESVTYVGRYPVGENGFWHSGIHVKNRWIYPMLEGRLVACRIPSGHSEVKRPSRISLSEYAALRQHEQNMYEVKLHPGHGIGSTYTLKSGIS